MQEGTVYRVFWRDFYFGYFGRSSSSLQFHNTQILNSIFNFENAFKTQLCLSGRRTKLPDIFMYVGIFYENNCDGTKSYLSLPITIIGILSYLELSYLMWNSFLLISRLQHSAPLHATNMSTLPDSFLVSIPVPSNCKYYCVFICISYTVCV